MRLTIVEVRDRVAILDCLNRYAQGVDQRNWSLYDSAFAEEALVDVRGYLDRPVTPAEFRDILCGTFDATRLSGQHLLGNTVISFKGDLAHSVTEFLAVTLERSANSRQSARQVTPGLYIDDLIRQDGDWRISRRTLIRKASNETILSFVDPFATGIETTLKTGWPLIPNLQEIHE